MGTNYEGCCAYTVVIAFEWFVTYFTVLDGGSMALAVIPELFFGFVFLFTETARKFYWIFALVFCLVSVSKNKEYRLMSRK